jgi:hypothetical protein
MQAARTNYYEMWLVHPECQNSQPPVYKGNYSDMIDTIEDDGTVSVPDEPGLDVEYDREFIKNHKTGSHTYESSVSGRNAISCSFSGMAVYVCCLSSLASSTCLSMVPD